MSWLRTWLGRTVGSWLGAILGGSTVQFGGGSIGKSFVGQERLRRLGGRRVVEQTRKRAFKGRSLGQGFAGAWISSAAGVYGNSVGRSEAKGAIAVAAMMGAAVSGSSASRASIISKANWSSVHYGQAFAGGSILSVDHGPDEEEVLMILALAA